MTAANARYHLAGLTSEGVIIVIGTRNGGGRGRPNQLYRMAEPAARHNLDQLADILLKMSVEGRDPEETEAWLKRIASYLAGETYPRKNPAQRLNQAIKRLNELNYRAYWEAHIPAPKVVFGHCPYQAILSEHPELCQLDALLLGSFLSGPVTQTARLVRNASGLHQCIFSVNTRL